MYCNVQRKRKKIIILILLLDKIKKEEIECDTVPNLGLLRNGLGSTGTAFYLELNKIKLLYFLLVQ